VHSSHTPGSSPPHGLPVSEAPLPRPRRSPWRIGLKVTAILAVGLFCAAAGTGLYLATKFTNRSLFSLLTHPQDITEPLFDPKAVFPGQDRITVLCLGLDRNYLISKDPKLNGMPYTKGARSDVMMVASLDLQNQSVSILSIPRDTRILLPKHRSYAKINQAHAEGGIPYTRKAVEQFLGVSIDYHVVIKQEAVQRLVDNLGGVDVNVPFDMDYEDHWGHLFIHLKAGPQHLSGEQTVGYMRYRHGDPQGDLGRIKRQQEVIQQLAHTAKNPMVIARASELIDTIKKYIDTDFSPKQQLALANLFHKISPENVVTASLPVSDDVTIDRVSYVIPDESKKEAVVDWIIRGNPTAMNRMIRVEVKNASGDRKLTDTVCEFLRASGFDVSRGSRVPGDPAPASRVVQRTNLKGAARRVLDVLGLGGNVEKLQEGGADVTLYVGRDLESNTLLANRDMWPEPPPRTSVSRIPDSEVRMVSRPRRPRRGEEAPTVRVESADPGEDEGKPEEPDIDVPGTADPPAPDDGREAPPADPGRSTPDPGSPDPAPDTTGKSGHPPGGVPPALRNLARTARRGNRLVRRDPFSDAARAPTTNVKRALTRKARPWTPAKCQAPRPCLSSPRMTRPGPDGGAPSGSSSPRSSSPLSSSRWSALSTSRSATASGASAPASGAAGGARRGSSIAGML
jgi:LCP family protein required for cell wall assembly